jgi:hypothetical protein
MVKIVINCENYNHKLAITKNSVVIFATLPFLHNLQMGPISEGVCL